MARYPAPPSSRRLYDAQAYPQQQNYDNRGYAPQYGAPQVYAPRRITSPAIRTEAGQPVIGVDTASASRLPAATQAPRSKNVIPAARPPSPGPEACYPAIRKRLDHWQRGSKMSHQTA